MNEKSKNVNVKRALVWGGSLILLGGTALIETYTDIGGWPWIVMLLVGGFGVLGIYRTARSERWMGYAAYTYFAVAVMVSLILIGWIEGVGIASYVLFVIAAPFIAAYARNLSLWWSLIAGGILSIVGIALLVSSKLALLVVPAVLILAGVFIITRMGINKTA